MQAAPLQSPLSCFRERWENGERTEVGGGNASSQYFYFSDRLSLYFTTSHSGKKEWCSNWSCTCIRVYEVNNSPFLESCFIFYRAFHKLLETFHNDSRNFSKTCLKVAKKLLQNTKTFLGVILKYKKMSNKSTIAKHFWAILPSNSIAK